jgi:hypothetical protein
MRGVRASQVPPQLIARGGRCTAVAPLCCQQDPLRSFTGRDKYKRMSPIADTVTDAKAVRTAGRAPRVAAPASLRTPPRSPAVARNAVERPMASASSSLCTDLSPSHDSTAGQVTLA